MKRAKANSKSLNALFIGNSFTARNDLPGLIEKLAAAHGYRFQHQLINVGGASLRTHWNKGEALKAIKTGKFDRVILQEQSTLPVKNAARMHENVRLFNEAIRAGGAKTVLYMTWARRHSPEHQKLISKAYESIGREVGSTVAPVGVAWQKFLAKHDSPVLHDKDESHPTLAGSYLAACVFLEALFGKSPTKPVDLDGLSEQDQLILQRAGYVRNPPSGGTPGEGQESADVSPLSK